MNGTVEINYCRLYLPVMATKSKKPLKQRHTNAGFRFVGGKKIYCYSRWEANYVRYLEWIKENGFINSWSFIKAIPKGTTFRPRICVHDTQDKKFWIEIHGYYDEKNLKKLEENRKFYPKESVIIIGPEWFKERGKEYKKKIQGWE